MKKINQKRLPQLNLFAKNGFFLIQGGSFSRNCPCVRAKLFCLSNSTMEPFFFFKTIRALINAAKVKFAQMSTFTVHKIL